MRVLLKKLAIGFILFSILFLGSIGLAPGISIRNIVLVLLSIYVLFNIKDVTIGWSEKLYFIYIAVLIFCNILNGQALEFHFIQNIVSYHFACVVLILFIPLSIKDKSDLSFITLLMIIFFLINFVLTCLQYYNHPIGWDIARFLYPTFDVKISNIEILNDLKGVSVAHGILGFSVTNGYFIASFLPVVSYLMLKGGIRRYIGLFLLLVGLVGLFMVQQRSAFALGVIYSIMAIIFMFRKEFYLFPIFLVILMFIVLNLGSLEHGSFDMGRLVIDDYTMFDDRLNVLNLFDIYMLEDNFLFGGERREFWLLTLGHNTIFSALLRGGVITMVVYIIVFFVILFDCIYIILSSVKRGNVLAFVYGVSCCIYVGVSFTHSTGIQSGAIMFWLSYVLMKKIYFIEN